MLNRLRRIRRDGETEHDTTLTNGLLLNPERSERLAALARAAEYSLDLRISLDGYDAPSKADLVILVLTQALIPFGATLGEGAADCYGKFPEAVALGERAAAFPAVAEWLTNDLCNLKKPPKAARE